MHGLSGGLLHRRLLHRWPQRARGADRPPTGPLLALLVLSVIGTGIATVVFLKLVTVAGPSFTSFINYLIPVWALLMGVSLWVSSPARPRLLASA